MVHFMLTVRVLYHLVLLVLLSYAGGVIHVFVVAQWNSSKGFGREFIEEFFYTSSFPKQLYWSHCKSSDQYKALSPHSCVAHVFSALDSQDIFASWVTAQWKIESKDTAGLTPQQTDRSWLTHAPAMTVWMIEVVLWFFGSWLKAGAFKFKMNNFPPLVLPRSCFSACILHIKAQL